MTAVTNFESVRSAARRTAPWSGIFAAVAKGVSTAAELINSSGLDWRVSEHKLFTEAGQPVPSHKAIIRDDSTAVLGVVGTNYEPLQNAEAFAFVDDIVGGHKAEYAGAGTFDNGKSLYVQVRLPAGDEIARGDVVWPFVTFANSHDGSGAVHCGLSTIRIYCWNSMRMSIREGKKAKQAVSIRHTKNLRTRLDDATKILGLARQTYGDFVSNAKRLVAVNVKNEKALRAYFREVLGASELDLERKGNRYTAKVDRMVELFTDGAGNNLPEVTGSWWAALNAVTEYTDHEASTAVRGAEGMQDAEKATATRERRLASALAGAGADLKEHAFMLAMEAAA